MPSFKLDKNTSAKKQALSVGALLIVLSLVTLLLVDFKWATWLGLAGLIALIAGAFASD